MATRKSPPKDTQHFEDADERAMAAASRLFREKGFAATTIREVAAAADILPGSLHYRFPSKESILLALINRSVKRVLAAIQAVVADEKDPLQRVRLALRAHLELLCEKDDALYVLLFDWRSLPAGAREGLERARQRYERFWEGLLREAHGSGRTWAVLDVELVRHFGFGAVNWVATWYRPESGRTPAQIADALWSFLAFGLVKERASAAELETHFAALMGASLSRRP